MVIENGDNLIIKKNYNEKFDVIGLFIENKNDNQLIEAKICEKNGKYSIKRITPERSKKWVWIEILSDMEELILKSKEKYQLCGIRTQRDQQTLWPWEKTITLYMERDGSNYDKIRFDKKEIFKRPNLPITVMFDNGVTIAAKILR